MTNNEINKLNAFAQTLHPTKGLELLELIGELIQDEYDTAISRQSFIDERAGIPRESQIRSTFNHDIALADNVNGYVNKDAA